MNTGPPVVFSLTALVFTLLFCFYCTTNTPLTVVRSSDDVTRLKGGGVESSTTEPEDDDNKNDAVAAAAANLVFRAACSDSLSFFGEVLFFDVTFLFVALFFDFLILSDAAAFFVMDM